MKKKILLILMMFEISLSSFCGDFDRNLLNYAEVMTLIEEKTGQKEFVTFVDSQFNELLGLVYTSYTFTSDTRGNRYMFLWASLVGDGEGIAIKKQSRVLNSSEGESYFNQASTVQVDSDGLGYKLAKSVLKTPDGKYYLFEDVDEFLGAKKEKAYFFWEPVEIFKFSALKKAMTGSSGDFNLYDYLDPYSSFYSSSSLAVGQTLYCNDNLRLRKSESTSSSIVTTMMKGTRVRIIDIGSSSTIDGITSNWVKISVLAGGKDKDGRAIPTGTVGWCFSGFLNYD